MPIRTLRIFIWATVLFVVVFAASVIAMTQQGMTVGDAVYTTSQLLVLEDTNARAHSANPLVLLAKFVLPLYPAAAILSLVFKVAGMQMHFVRIFFRPPEVVILGMKPGTEHLLIKGSDSFRIVFVSEHIETLIERGFKRARGQLWLNQTPEDLSLLKKLQLSRTKAVYVFGQDDRQTLAIAKKIVGLGVSGPRLLVALDDRETLIMASQDPALTSYMTDRDGDLVWLNIQALCARRLVAKYGSVEKPHYIFAIEKESDPFFEIVLQLARQCVFTNAKKAEITVISPSKDEITALTDRFPALRQLVSIHHVSSAGYDDFTQKIQQSLTQNTAAIFTGNDSDYGGLAIAKRAAQACTLAGLQQIPVVALLPGTQYGNAEQVPSQLTTGIEIFHTVADAMRYSYANELYAGEAADRMGIVIHAAYKALTAHGVQGDDLKQVLPEAAAEWRTTLAEPFRFSSRQSGENVLLKLKWLGFNALAEALYHGQKPQDLNQQLEKLANAIEENLEQLRRFEHQRFVNERLLDGWHFHPTTNKPMKLNNTLIPFDDLPEHEKAKDDAVIRAMPVLIKQLFEWQVEY